MRLFCHVLCEHESYEQLFRMMDMLLCTFHNILSLVL